MSYFDFGSYVQGYLSAENHTSSHSIATSSLAKPTFSWQVLTGGLTNHTARLSFTASSLRDVLSISFMEGAHPPDADLLDQVSVILKHAPPYIAADPTQPMSVDRQLIEKTALHILNSREKDANEPELWKGLERLPEGRNVRIPRLIWHDRHKNVLWIEDLGEKMKTLSEVLLDDSAEFGSSGEPQRRTRLEKIASDLGSFLARLYSATSNPPERLVSFLTTSSDHNSIHDYLAKMVIDNLLRSEAGVSETEARALAERVRLGLQENTKLSGEEMCLGMVDFWPGSVLIDIGDSDKSRDRFSRCGLVDWEYFGPSNAASELGMFLAHLHIHMLNSTTSTRTQERVQLFAEGMFRGYAESQETLETDLKIIWEPSNTFKRRALLSHGREMVNGVALFEAKLDEAAKRRILAAGVRSLRAAGSSTDELDLGELGSQAANLMAPSPFRMDFLLWVLDAKVSRKGTEDGI